MANVNMRIVMLLATCSVAIGLLLIKHTMSFCNKASLYSKQPDFTTRKLHTQILMCP